MLSKLAVRRLTKLADFMDALPKEANKHFDMGSWAEHVGKHDNPIMNGEAVTVGRLMDCGTTACAAGWACSIPQFRKAGLRMVKDGIGAVDVVYKDESGDDDARSMQVFFNIERIQAWHLFSYNEEITTPKQWARHCRKFLKANA